MVKIIQSACDFSNLLYKAKPRKRKRIYNQVKEDLLKLIESHEDLPLVFEHLNEKQRSEIYEKDKDRLKQFAFEHYISIRENKGLDPYFRKFIKAELEGFLNLLNVSLRDEVIKKFGLIVVEA